MQSEKIGDLAKALAEAQLVIKPPTKGRTASIPGKEGRQGYSYKYADLADIIEAYREPLSKQGLALAQSTRVEDGHIVLVTKLLHSSGEWLASEYPVTMFTRPQEQGSAITYARRYAVSALLGIAAEEDDDGQAAQEGTPKPKAAPAKAPTNGGPSRDEVEKIHTAAKRAGIKTPAELAPVLTNICGVGKATEVAPGEVKNVLDALEAMVEHRETA